MMPNTKLYEGKAKTLFADGDDACLIQYFKDDVTAFEGKKHAVLAGKGLLTNRISAALFADLAEAGIPHHLIARLDDRRQRIRHCAIIPVEVVVRNMVAGSMLKRLSGKCIALEKGQPLPAPLLEYYLKDDDLGDPMLLPSHITALGLASEDELAAIEGMALKTNAILTARFASIGITLVDFKLEFGRPYKATPNDPPLMLADEISPDSCRLWDSKSGEVLDKDRFRHDLGDLIAGYQEVARRLGLSDALVDEASSQTKEAACV